MYRRAGNLVAYSLGGKGATLTVGPAESRDRDWEHGGGSGELASST